MWSGNFKIECEVSQMQSARLVAGVSDDDFSWTLEPGGQFAAPEVLFCYSDQGLSELSARYHRFFAVPHHPQPLAGQAPAHPHQQLGGHLHGLRRPAHLGHRPPGPGTWGWRCWCWTTAGSGSAATTPAAWGTGSSTRKKLGCTFDQLIGRVREMGLLFGLWIEPEMVCANHRPLRRPSRLGPVHPGPGPRPPAAASWSLTWAGPMW